ncbi:MAG: ComEC/Rec2 family competence protein [Candidatus Omnitrophota bacterium]
MQYPLAILCIAFCLGIVFATYIKLPFFVFYLAAFLAFLSGAIFIKRKALFHVFILILFFIIGASRLVVAEILPNCHIAQLTPYKSRIVTLKGQVDSDPSVNLKKTTFILRVQELYLDQIKQNVCGKVLISSFIKDNFEYGERLILTGSLYRPLQPWESGAFNYADYLSRRGIYSLFNLKKDSVIEHLGDNKGNILRRLSFWSKHKLRNVMLKNLPAEEAALLGGMMLGERQNISRALREVFVLTGTAHILAISGLHVGIIAFILLAFLKVLSIPAKPRFVIIIISLIGYYLLTGSSASTLRATIMAIVLIIGFLIQREADIYNSLSFSALVILAVNPHQLFDVGFQLSFLSVFSIIWLSPKVKTLFLNKFSDFRPIQFLINAMSVSFGAWLGTLVLIVYYFQVFSPVTVLANLIVVPFMSVVLALGLLFSLAGLILPKFVEIFALTSQFSLAILVKINLWLAGLPFAYFYLPQIPLYCVLLYYMLLILLANHFFLDRRKIN